MPSAALQQAIAALRAQARRTGQRRCLLLSGTRPWGIARALDALPILGRQGLLWVSDTPPPDIPYLPPAQFHKVLGRELQTVVMDAYAGFDPEAFGALVGTVRGGGLLLLICPPLDQWPDFPDPQNRRIAVAPHAPEDLGRRYRARLVRVLRESPGLAMAAQGEPIAVAEPPPSTAQVCGPAPDRDCRTGDQQRAVQALEHLAGGRRHRPLVLVSDRGRGKSSALGIAAARLMRGGVAHILLTGPRLEAVRPALEHAARLLPGAEQRAGQVRFAGCVLEFMPPDTLSTASVDAGLVLVDEAAALPAPLLERLLRRHGRIAFATTVHGYEGTGRGFAVRFRRLLQTLTPEWRELRLEEPIRWAPDDPLERLAFRTLLLDADPAPEQALATMDGASGTVRELDRDRLARDERRLGELFGLLVLAHYRTSPLDLMHLLDGPNLSVLTLEQGEHVAATALLADEGGLDPDIAHQVWLGRRRLRGHLLPQSLAQHLGIEQAPRLRLRRVMRIAVHPAIQGRGLGTRLLREIATRSSARGFDCVGTSFGADLPLLRFWRRSGFLPVRLGLSRDAASASRSAQLLRPLNAAGTALLENARQRFGTHLPYQLGDILRDVEPALAADLLRGLPAAGDPELSPEDWRDLAAVAFGRRRAETAAGPLWRLACRSLCAAGAPSLLAGDARQLLVARVLQRRGWKACADLLGLPGRDAAVDLLRRTLARLLEHDEVTDATTRDTAPPGPS
jgi:tRNA(Met) cytidine acetyltransferase